MKPAIFLDKDGTLIPDIPYNVNPDLITLYPDVEYLMHLQNMGYLIIVVSNQAGIAKGLFNKRNFVLVQNKIKTLLSEHNIHLDAFYYCPHHPDGIIEEFSIICNCRKPWPGMLYKAANDLNIDLNKSWMIGDILNDIEAGNRAGCKTILINNGNETEWEINEWRNPNFETTNLKEAATYIINSTAEKYE